MLLSLVLCALVAVTVTQAAVTPHIIGGEKATYGDHPYGCSLQYKSGRNWYHSCGSAIWNRDWIVTAAHCVDGNIQRRVVCGLHRIDTHDQGQQGRAVVEVITHEKYGKGSGRYPNDIAVLRLGRPLTYSDKVHAYRLANPGDGDFAGEVCTISGWGEKDDGYLANTLKKVDMTTVTNQACDKDWNYDGSIIDSHVCIREDDKSSCGGDSGGPQRCGDVIVGLTSWGVGDCSPAIASVNTRLSSFHRWIVTTTQSDQEFYP